MSQIKKITRTLKRRCSTSTTSVHTSETPKKKIFTSLPGDFAYEAIPVQNTCVKRQNELQNTKTEELAEQAQASEQSNIASLAQIQKRKILTATKASESRKRKFFAQFSQGEMIGCGSFGKVYAGIRLRDQLPVAIKYVPKDTCKNVQAGPYQKTPAEIFFQLNIHHPNIITLLEHHYFDGAYVLVFERPSRCTDLFEHLSKYENNAINEQEGKTVFREILDAVSYLDRQGVLHNDIKTENVIIDLSNGRTKAKLTDFGLAWHLTSQPIKKFTGTPEFSPPEYHIQKHYDGRQATVWCLGCFLFDMVTGNPPYSNACQAASLPLRIPNHFSQDLKSFLGIMLEKRPSQRARLCDLQGHPWIKTS